LAFGASGVAALAAPAIVRAQGSGVVNLYSARHYQTDEALYSEFTNQTGIRVSRIDADADPLLERLKAEGRNSPADVFITVDAGRIERARAEGLLQAIASPVLNEKIPAHLRAQDDTWYGFSKRARVLIYSRERVRPSQLSTYEDLADPKWRGKILVRSSSNVYNQSLVGALLAAHGPERTEQWARGLVANFARPPAGGDRDQFIAVAAGQGDVAISNTYYLFNMARPNNPNAREREVVSKVNVFFPNQSDRGTHVNLSAGAVTAHAPNKANAIKFLEYLASPSAQRYFAEGNSEYPVVPGVASPPWVTEYGSFREDQLNAQVFARNNAEALRIMDRAGWR
jgi:iron(III) transport system substrate-binding protein